MTGFFQSWNSKPQETQKEEFQLNETMLIKDLPKEIASKFVQAYNEVLNNQNKSVIQEGKNNTEKFLKIMNATKLSLDNDLPELARLIDSSNDEISQFNNHLENSKIDYSNRLQPKSAPSPYIVRMINRIQDSYRELGNEIDSSICELDTERPFNVHEAFSYQFKALIQSASQVSNLSEELSKIREEVRSKLHINVMENNESNGDSLISTLKLNYSQFLNEEKMVQQKFIEKCTLEAVIEGESPVITKMGAIAPLQIPSKSFIPMTSASNKSLTDTSSTIKKDKAIDNLALSAPPPPPKAGQKGPFS